MEKNNCKPYPHTDSTKIKIKNWLYRYIDNNKYIYINMTDLGVEHYTEEQMLKIVCSKWQWRLRLLQFKAKIKRWFYG